MAAPQAHSQARPSDAKHYVEYEEYVDFQLEKTRSIVKRTDILTTLTTLAVAVIAYLFVFVVFDQWIIAGGFSYTARVLLLSLVTAVVTGTLVLRVLFPLLKQVHPLYAARVIERSDPQLKSNLVNFVDVKMSNAESAPVVLKSMQKRAAVELSHIDVEEAVDHRPLLRVAYALLAVVIIAAVYIVWSPKDPFASVRRALLPTSPIEVATETTISDVNPDGDSAVPARTVVTIEAEVRGKDANHAQVLYTTHDHKYVDQIVEMRRIDENLTRFRGVLNGENGRGLLQSLTYRIVAGDAHTRDYVVNVIQPPGARIDEVHYAFPTYMQLEEKTTSVGDIDGWEGAVVTVKATANVPIKTAMIVLSDTEDVHAKGEETMMQIADGTRLSASWKLEFRSDGTSARFYHIDVKTDKGEVDPDPTVFTFRIRPDQRPEAALLAPAGDLTMPANGTIPLVIQASDPDFQLRSVTLKAERNGEAFLDQRLFEERELGQSFRGTHDFRLDPLRLTPGESFLFWIEVKDNKQPTANRANTPRIKVDIGKPVTTAEAQKQLAEEKQKQQDQLAKASEANNSDDVQKPQPREADEAKPDDAQPRPDRPEPSGEKPADPKRAQKQPDQENSGDDVSEEPGDKPGRKAQKKATEEEALQRLLKKQPREQPDDQQQPANDEKQADQTNKTDGHQSDRGKGSKAGQKSDKPDRAKSKQDQSKTKAGSNDNGDNKDDGAQPGDSPKPADSKPKVKPNAGDQKNQSDENTGDKPAAGKKAVGLKPGDDKDAADDEKDPGEQNGSADKKGAGKKDTGSKEKGKDGANKSDAAKKDAGHDAGKEGASDDDAAKDDSNGGDAKQGDAEQGDADKPDAGKNADGKKDGGKKDSGSPQDMPDSAEKPAADQKQKAQGGAGQKGAADSDAASNSKDQSKAKGSPGKSDKPAGDQQAGDGKGEKTQKQGDGPAKASDDPNPSGKEEPAEDDPNAKKNKATGNETGEATGNEEADPDATQANNDLKKKEGSQEGARKSSAGSDPKAKKTGQKRQPQDGTKQGSPDADNAERAPDGKKPTEQPGELDEPGSKTAAEKQADDSEKRPGQPPDVGNKKDDPGDGRKKGQKSDQPQAGEKGSSAATDKGKKGANKPGAGDKGDAEGNTDPTTQKTGQPGDKKEGPGSTSKPSEDGQGQKKDGPGGEKGQKSSPQSGQGQEGDQPGEEGAGGEKSAGKKGQPGGKQGAKDSGGKESGGKESGGKAGTGGNEGQGEAGKPGSKPGNSKGQADGQPAKPGKPGDGQRQSGSGASSLPPNDGKQNGAGQGADVENAKPRERSADEPTTPEDEEANLEAARKATNLVLQRLKSQLERGEVDQELMDELGWKDKKDVERFVKFLEKGMGQQGDDHSPEAEARRMQFEETLKSMDLSSDTQRRNGSTGKERAIEQIGAKNAPVPREYEKVWQSYTRSLSKQGDKGDAKAKGADKSKVGKGK